MPEHIPGLPDPIAVPLFHPEGYDVSRTGARRRRRRQLALTGGGLASLSTLVVAALLLQGPGGRQVLAPADRTPASGSTASSERASAHETPPPTAQPTGSAGPIPSRVGALATPQSNGSPSPSEGPTSATPLPEGAISGPDPTVTSYAANRACDGSGPTAPSGWCSYYDGARTARRGTTAELASSVCRMPGRGVGTLRSDDGEYAGFFVATRAQGVLWSWAHGRRFAVTPRSFQVAEGSCLRLAVTWNLTGNDGQPLPAGQYDADARPKLDFGDGASVSGGFVFTIT